MTNTEHELFQEQLHHKLNDKRLFDEHTQKYNDGYKDCLKCVMSMLHQYYTYHNMKS
jgi:hypothetical protein